ncbi:hypothetical protein GDO81_023272 [Engystomops pustulosus]|uniref:Uncharacterized protein n=1 Tax=Engystomops pustulosus TaxID=76066 RepID=A0AAV6YLS6_ENGPU|nr:hypothetical protein GDO81_023272 [Engystomops pustulosus]
MRRMSPRQNLLPECKSDIHLAGRKLPKIHRSGNNQLLRRDNGENLLTQSCRDPRSGQSDEDEVPRDSRSSCTRVPASITSPQGVRRS